QSEVTVSTNPTTPSTVSTSTPTTSKFTKTRTNPTGGANTSSSRKKASRPLKPSPQVPPQQARIVPPPRNPYEPVAMVPVPNSAGGGYLQSASSVPLLMPQLHQTMGPFMFVHEAGNAHPRLVSFDNAHVIPTNAIVANVTVPPTTTITAVPPTVSAPRTGSQPTKAKSASTTTTGKSAKTATVKKPTSNNRASKTLLPSASTTSITTANSSSASAPTKVSTPAVIATTKPAATVTVATTPPTPTTTTTTTTQAAVNNSISSPSQQQQQQQPTLQPKNKPTIDPAEREKLRKVSHSAIERRRRERINDKISQLRRLVPVISNNSSTSSSNLTKPQNGDTSTSRNGDTSTSRNTGGFGSDPGHKLSILQDAIDYITEMQNVIRGLVCGRDVNVLKQLGIGEEVLKGLLVGVAGVGGIEGGINTARSGSESGMLGINTNGGGSGSGNGNNVVVKTSPTPTLTVTTTNCGVGGLGSSKMSESSVTSGRSVSEEVGVGVNGGGITSSSPHCAAMKIENVEEEFGGRVGYRSPVFDSSEAGKHGDQVSGSTPMVQHSHSYFQLLTSGHNTSYIHNQQEPYQHQHSNVTHIPPLVPSVTLPPLQSSYQPMSTHYQNNQYNPHSIHPSSPINHTHPSFITPTPSSTSPQQQQSQSNNFTYQTVIPSTKLNMKLPPPLSVTQQQQQHSQQRTLSLPLPSPPPTSSSHPIYDNSGKVNQTTVFNPSSPQSRGNNGNGNGEDGLRLLSSYAVSSTSGGSCGSMIAGDVRGVKRTQGEAQDEVDGDGEMRWKRERRAVGDGDDCGEVGAGGRGSMRVRDLLL
ncbi:hypothetical protein HDU76_004079, partial [Blyttiomyces sp. JEL0837]